MAERTRKAPGPKVTLEVFKRDNYTCVICGRSPATTPGLQLEVDHVEPFSKGGADALANYQTLCQRCNRGKGNRDELNKALAADIAILLDDINPAIRPQIQSTGAARAVANQEDYVQLIQANDGHDPPLYEIRLLPNTIIGFGAGGSIGHYAVRDSGGAKANFVIAAMPR